MESKTAAPRRSRLRIGLGILLGAVAALALFAASASATTIYYHPLIGQFGPKGPADPAKFASPLAVAADPGSHDVYVADVLNGKFYYVYRFNGAGEPKSFTEGPGAGTNAELVAEIGFKEGAGPALKALAVAPPGSPAGTAGDLYVSVGGKVEVYSPNGAHLGTIDGSGNANPGSTAAKRLTVGPDGALYVLYPEHLDKYVPSANPPKNSDFDSELQVGAADATVAAATITIATPATFLNPWARYPLSAFPGGGGSAALPAPEVTGTAWPNMATDFSTNDFYIVGEHGYSNPDPRVAQAITSRAIEQYDSAGNPIGYIEVGNPDLDFDVDSGSGKIYHVGSVVQIYGKGEAVQTPTASIDPASGLKFNSAQFSGTVNPGGSGPLQETVYRFVCGPTCPGLEGDRPIPGDGADHAVSEAAKELQPETKYKVTLIARNANWVGNFPASEVRSSVSFETPPKPPAIEPEVTIDPVAEFGAESAQVSGTVDPKGTGELQETSYRFEYSSDGGEHWKSAGDQGPIEGGAQEVSDELEGLEPNTAYEVRLRAENVGGAVTTKAPNPSFTTEAAAPEVEMTAATGVLAGSAQLNGRIDPRNSQTSYYFEWGKGDCASNPCAALPLSKDADAGSGHELGWVNQQLSGLEAGTEYSYRLVAENQAGKAVSPSSSFTTEAAAGPCPNEALRGGGSANLPDCRAYEMVSPLDKNGGNVATMSRHTRVAVDGNAVTFESTAAFAGATGAPYDGVEYMALRGPGGWATHAISPFQAAPAGATGKIYDSSGADYIGSLSPDLDTGVFHATAPIAGATSANVAERFNLYLATGLRGPDPRFQLLTDSETPLGTEPDTEEFLAYAGASADFHKVVFEDQANLVAPASGGETKVYEAEGGTVRLAGILPDSACGSPPCAAQRSFAGAGASSELEGLGTHGTYTEAMHAVSADGSKVFFTQALSKQETDTRGHLYARLNGTETVQIDASERTVPQPALVPQARFGGASADGSVVYFTTNESLVDEPHGARLYRYDFDKPVGQRLTAIPLPGVVSQESEVMGVSVSGDIAYVMGGSNRLFVVHGGRASMVADVAGTGSRQMSNSDYWEVGTFRMTPDGRHVSFVTTAEALAGYDSADAHHRCRANHCEEVYAFSYDSGEVTCASCNYGNAPAGDALYGDLFNNNAYSDVGFFGLDDPSWRLPMSDDGRYLFFSSRDALVPQDSNGSYDAYVYDTEKQQVRLLSSGQCACNSRFAGTSPSGRDAFFTTYGPLVRVDSDNLVDLYDARIGGGIAAQNAPPPAECQGDACQPVPGPVEGVTPTSAAFSGPGSPPPTRGNRKCKHRKRCRHHGGKHKHVRKHAKQGGSK